MSANYPNVRPSLLLDFANSQQLDPRITFTRSTTAPYYDGKTSALAEQNLFTSSQVFNVSNWSKTSATAVDNSTTAPDGTTTACLVTISAQYGGVSQVQTLLANTVYTLSVWVLAGTGTNQLSLQGGSGGGSVAFTPTGTWTRQSFTFTNVTAGSFNTYAIIDRNASGFGTVYIWGAQLEQRSSVTAYNATTTLPINNYIPQLLTAPINAPRFDFNPVTSESLGLLIEQSSTNLVIYSQDFSNVNWSKSNSSITSGANIAPDGTQTAMVLVENTATSTHQTSIGAGTATSGQVGTFSIYVKAYTRSQIQLQYVSASGFQALFDVSTQTVVSSGGIFGGTAPTSATITSVGNGWYRCVMSGVFNSANTGLSASVGIQLSTSGNITYTGNGYSGIYLWGAQLEALAFPTSYIATTSAQVTRGIEQGVITGTNFSSWFNSAQGTFYADFIPISNFGSSSRIFSNQNTTNEFLGFYGTSNTSVAPEMYDGTPLRYGFLNSSPSIKAASTFTFTTKTISANGYAPISTSSNGNYNNSTQLTIGGLQGSNFTSFWLKKGAFYPQAVTSTNQQALTGS
jgi:hypothetical protein